MALIEEGKLDADMEMPEDEEKEEEGEYFCLICRK